MVANGACNRSSRLLPLSRRLKCVRFLASALLCVSIVIHLIVPSPGIHAPAREGHMSGSTKWRSREEDPEREVWRVSCHCEPRALQPVASAYFRSCLARAEYSRMMDTSENGRSHDLHLSVADGGGASKDLGVMRSWIELGGQHRTAGESASHKVCQAQQQRDKEECENCAGIVGRTRECTSWLARSFVPSKAESPC